MKEYINTLKPYQDIDKVEIGIDEAGRGCLFGSLFVAGVILDPNFESLMTEQKIVIKDSKKLSKKRRMIAKEFIEKHAVDYYVHKVDSEIIDEKNILQATLEGMHEVVHHIQTKPNKILVDGNKFIPYKDENDEIIEHECIIGGDNSYLSIACASILAKTSKDLYIEQIVGEYPELEKYDLLNNSGYGTKKHIEAIKKYGISNFHRKTFRICNGVTEKKEKKHITKSIQTIDDLVKEFKFIN